MHIAHEEKLNLLSKPIFKFPENFMLKICIIQTLELCFKHSNFFKVNVRVLNWCPFRPITNASSFYKSLFFNALYTFKGSKELKKEIRGS